MFQNEWDDNNLHYCFWPEQLQQWNLVQVQKAFKFCL